MTQALSGAEARGQGPSSDRPYNETLNYDAFAHLTYHGTKHWSKLPPGFVWSGTFIKNRRNGWEYDAAGNLTNDSKHQNTFDAAGRMVVVSSGAMNMSQSFDGDGQRVKMTVPNVVTYYLRSTVLGGQVVADLDGNGNKQTGYIYLGKELLAEQYQVTGGISLVHGDPSGVSIRKTNAQYGNTVEFSEMDPLGADVETDDPYLNNPNYNGRGEGGPLFPGFGNVTDPGTGCTLDGVYAPCDWLARMLGAGALALKITSPGNQKGVIVPIEPLGMGLSGVWIDDWSRRTGMHHDHPNDPNGPDIVYSDTDINNGHWAFIIVGQERPLTTIDDPRFRQLVPTQRKLEALSREGVSLIVDQTLAFLDTHKACEDAFNALLAGLGRDTGVAPAAGTIRGVLEQFRASGDIYPYAGSAGSSSGSLGMGTGAVALGFNTYGSSAQYGSGTLGDYFFDTVLHEITHAAYSQGPSSSYSDQAMYNVFAKQGIYTMTAEDYQKQNPSENAYSLFAAAGTELICAGYKRTILK